MKTKHAETGALAAPLVAAGEVNLRGNRERPSSQTVAGLSAVRNHPSSSRRLSRISCHVPPPDCPTTRRDAAGIQTIGTRVARHREDGEWALGTRGALPCIMCPLCYWRRAGVANESVRSMKQAGASPRPRAQVATPRISTLPSPRLAARVHGMKVGTWHNVSSVDGQSDCAVPDLKFVACHMQGGWVCPPNWRSGHTGQERGERMVGLELGLAGHSSSPPVW